MTLGHKPSSLSGISRSHFFIIIFDSPSYTHRTIRSLNNIDSSVIINLSAILLPYICLSLPHPERGNLFEHFPHQVKIGLYPLAKPVKKIDVVVSSPEP